MTINFGSVQNEEHQIWGAEQGRGLQIHIMIELDHLFQKGYLLESLGKIPVRLNRVDVRIMTKRTKNEFSYWKF